VIPILLLTELLTIAANEFLGVDPLLKAMAAVAIALMSFALVGLAISLGARYPRFGGDPSQVAGSYGGVAFMTQAVLFVIAIIALFAWPSSLYLMHQIRNRPLTTPQLVLMASSLATAVGLSLAVWLASMRSGVRALEKMADG
jgi:hypothetical protein